MADDAFIGEIRIFPYDWAPEGWLPCDGQELSVAQYQALFSILEYTYGGTVNKSFCLPDLRGRAVTSAPLAKGEGMLNRGQSAGADSVSLTSEQIPSHLHAVVTVTGGIVAANKSAVPATGYRLSRLETLTGLSTARTYVPSASAGTPVALSPAMIEKAGGKDGIAAPHENRQPFCAMNFCICVDGEYPSAG